MNLHIPRVLEGTTWSNNLAARPNISILSRPWPRNCGNHLGPISRGECDVDSLAATDEAAGCGLPLARQPLDAGKSALTSFREDTVFVDSSFARKISNDEISIPLQLPRKLRFSPILLSLDKILINFDMLMRWQIIVKLSKN